MTTRRTAMTLMCAALMSAAGGAALAADSQQWQLYTTAQGANERFVPQTLGAPRAATQPMETEIAVFVDTRRRFQEVFGFGGAITDAAAETYAKLKPDQQQAFLNAYFDPKQGLGYSILRTTIHSSDFSSASYTYVKEGDRSLNSFNIEHDMQYRIPLLRQALAAGTRKGTHMRVFASPWSAPAWMKSNKDMLHGGTLLPEYRDTWAQYMVRFVKAYEKAGIPIWGLTIQNEPMAKQTWESMLFTAEDETRFLGDHLGPALKSAGLGGKKVIVWDHNRDLLPQRAAHILDDKKARPYIWGVGYHWYETWAKGEPMHRNLAAVHEAYPDVPLLLTESSIEKFDPTQLQSWANGERYGSEILADLNAGSSGWVDWNMLLDSRGGPNHVGNYCFALLHASDDGQLVYTPSYAYMGHFTRYIKPKARRVSAATSRSTLDATAFRNADGSLAVVVMNKTAQAQRYRLVVDGQEVTVDIPAHAIQTAVR
ncbi:glycoside hydrolase family 30 beta sandwich domain-containing protein [Massilia norwichensis]|uniref:Glycosyl hydrolase n=1 Tax=Massilia norwichensis TaxID=1442366 RepID=A0ABT2A148_9BURK|nr:glycoside hydrolase family 30 protein [Massilia norwichensis]MCS0587860.1 glycosyl hydrolase [Massilia norwichensis]